MYIYAVLIYDIVQCLKYIRSDATIALFSIGLHLQDAGCWPEQASVSSSDGRQP